MSDELLRSLRQEGALGGLALPAGVIAGTLLKGHASRRRFVRLHDSTPALVAVVYPPDEAADMDRFGCVQAWLHEAGVRVPRIHARGERAFLVEDVGDLRLDRRDLPVEPELRSYRQALGAVVAIERHGRRSAPPNPELALDRERLRNELEHFERHTLRGWLEVDGRGEGERRAFYDRLADAVGSLPTVQCHRDFHSRNLLLHDERLVVLDFQDLMRGPVFYDVASLVLDDYREVPRVAAIDVLHRYRTAVRPRLLARDDARLPSAPAGLGPVERQAFCLVALQRSLKALGTFGYQVSVAGNGAYAAHAPRTWAHARRGLALLGWSDVRALTVPLERAFG